MCIRDRLCAAHDIAARIKRIRHAETLRRRRHKLHDALRPRSRLCIRVKIRFLLSEDVYKRQEYEYEIDAITGSVLKSDSDYDDYDDYDDHDDHDDHDDYDDYDDHDDYDDYDD